MEKQRGNPSHQEEEDSANFDNPEAEIWYYKGKQVTEEPLAQNSKAWGHPPLHTEPVLQLTRKVKKYTEDTWRHYLQISVRQKPLA